MAFDDLAPKARVVVNAVDIPLDVTNSLVSLEVDLARDIPDQIKLTIANPSSDQIGRGYDQNYTFIDSKIWLPGNHLDVYLGYGTNLNYVGSGIIQKWLPVFPQSGVPTLEIIAYDASHRLMDAETAAEPATYPEFDLDTIVLTILAKHDIDPGEVTPLVPSFQEYMTKKAGMTDYQFVKGLANLAAFEFKVQYDPVVKRWKGYWRLPTSGQAAVYTFTYGNNIGTLQNFEPQWGLRDAPSDVKVLYLDSVSKVWQELRATEVSAAIQKDVLGDRKASKAKEDFIMKNLTDRVAQGLESLDAIRVGTGGISVEIVAERPFPNAEAAERFAAQWIKAHRDNFITGSGKLVGFELLRPGDIHNIEGVGTLLSGEWEFTGVRHKFDVDRGFSTHFNANKVIAL